MKTFRRFSILITILAAVSGAYAASPARPKAVTADSARNSKHPASNTALLIPSAGMGMNTVLMQASGNGPKPTLILLHGLPGNEQNLDLAQAIRRAGWNVLTMHYRGSWGSPGNFSIAGAIQDAEAAMAFLQQPGNAAKYNIDIRRLFIGGHSMGGLAAAMYAARHSDHAGLVLVDAWNAGLDGKELNAHPEAFQQAVASFDDLGNSLTGTDATHLVQEIQARANEWDLTQYAAALAERPALVVGAAYGNGAANKQLADAIRAQRKGKINSRIIDSDHAFADHRIALSATVVNWLQRQVASKQ
jgi:pimeloyl-ACP methyl ester carboxylesterase